MKIILTIVSVIKVSLAIFTIIILSHINLINKLKEKHSSMMSNKDIQRKNK